MLQTVLLLITGAGVGLMVMPGFTLTMANLIMFAVVVLAPPHRRHSARDDRRSDPVDPQPARRIRSRRTARATKPASVATGTRSAAVDTARPRGVLRSAP